MATITITTCDNGTIELEGGKFRDETLLFGAADTWLAGTILSRLLVSNTIAVTYTRASDSNYTAAASAVAGRTLQVGAYTVTAGTLTTGVGTWTAVAPNGDTDTCTTAAASGDLTFPELGLFLDVTAVSSVFDTGDVITATVAAQSGTPLVPFSATGVNGAQNPVAILTYPITVTAGGSVSARVLVAGEVNRTRLVIDADGNGANITKAILDALCGQGIVATSVEQLSTLDNGAS
jgi:hypothetical protein